MSVSLLGQRVTWTVLERRRVDRRWRNVPVRERSGEVWSLGPTDETLWVLPYERYVGEGLAVCVAIKGAEFVQRPVDTERSKAGRQALELAARRAAAERSQAWHRWRVAR
jgi:hypothetical protein